MNVFDKIDHETLERRGWQLSMLALVIIFVLGGGMALLMYPAVFGTTPWVPAPFSRTLFYGFCALWVLMVAYLLNRQYMVRHLRTRLVEERKKAARLREQASSELLGTLPGFGRFQDRLAMAFRRAAQSKEPLSLLLARLKLSDVFGGGPETQVAYGDAAKVLLRKLREEDSLYRFSSDVFGIILPNTSGAGAKQIAERLAEGLADASGASNRFSVDIQVVNYPEHTTTASEMERVAATFQAQTASAPASAA
jgi:GGDEF domain-containing protein